jgi:hypothetical protein
MPYIKEEDRDKFLEDSKGGYIELLREIGSKCQTAGELNFCFTLIAQHYLKQKGLNYQHINDVVGALEGAKLELYRRIAAPYEDKKIAENGDVHLF